jgi:pimeloyl-ACP methyl ester carboxylesterase
LLHTSASGDGVTYCKKVELPCTARETIHLGRDRKKIAAFPQRAFTTNRVSGVSFGGAFGNDEIQLDLFLDYKSNVALYPKFQE